MEKLSYKDYISLRYYMCDRTRRVNLSTLVNLLIDVSGQQSITLNLSDNQLKKEGYSWIILQYEFTFNRIPKMKETIEIETFATEYNRLFCYRNFIVRDNEGNEIISIEATFALIDIEKRKMVRLPQNIIDPYKAQFNKRLKRTTRPSAVNMETATKKDYRVRYFDIDGNNHVNNSHYLTWAMDALDQKFLLDHDPVYCTVKFEKEVFEGQTVHSFVSIDESGDELTTNHSIQTDDTVNCTASFKWKKRS